MGDVAETIDVVETIDMAEKTDMVEQIAMAEQITMVEQIAMSEQITMVEQIAMAEQITMAEQIAMAEQIDMAEKIATRESYGNTLVEMAEQYPNLVVLDADLATATKTVLFKNEYPDRHIDCGIAECNMMGIAAGLAATGKIPFVSSFAMFAAGRAFEQVRNSIGYPHLNVKIGATHAGITVGEDGASHQCNEDIALMRTIPGMVIVNPCDDVEAKAAVKAALEYNGPMYLRFGRMATPVINNNAQYQFILGKGVLLKEGSDLTIVATGLCVAGALEAAKKLEKNGVYAEVINIHTIKPLDQELIISSAKKTRKVVTIEEHSVIGGLGSAVCETLCAAFPVPVLTIGMQDCFGESGSAVNLLKKYRLDADGIYEQISEFV